MKATYLLPCIKPERERDQVKEGVTFERCLWLYHESGTENLTGGDVGQSAAETTSVEGKFYLEMILPRKPLRRP
jgi:hypothetical protein